MATIFPRAVFFGSHEQIAGIDNFPPSSRPIRVLFGSLILNFVFFVFMKRVDEEARPLPP